MELSNLVTAVLTTTALLVCLYALSSLVLYHGLLPMAAMIPGRRVGRQAFYLLIMPGTVIHELSHYLACIFTRVRVFEVKLFDPRPNGVVGRVVYERCDPLRRNVIAFAPFAGGAIALYTLAALAFADSFGVRLPRLALRPDDWFGNLGLMIGTVVMTLAEADLKSGLTWLSLYLVFSIGYGIAPSKADLSHLLTDSMLVIALCLAVIAADALFSWDLASATAVRAVAGGLATLLTKLNTMLLFSSVVIGLCSLALVSVAFLLGRLRR